MLELENSRAIHCHGRVVPRGRSTLDTRPEYCAAPSAVFTWPLPSLAEESLTVTTLLYLGFVHPLLFGNVNPLNPAPFRPVDLLTKVVLLFGIAVYVVLYRDAILRTSWGIKLVLISVLLAPASVLWSQFPLLSLRGTAVLFSTTAFGLYLGCRYPLARQIQILAVSFLIVIALSFAAVFFFPQIGIGHGATAGDWRGIFPEKNNLGNAMVLGALVFAFWRPVRYRRLRWIAIIASLALVVLSNSATALVVLLCVWGGLCLVKALRTVPGLWFVGGIGLALCISIIVCGYITAQSLLHILHRKPDLTGRTELWTAALGSIERHPWLGYGFSAFWEGYRGQSKYVVESLGWIPWYAHDGYLDIVLQLGLVGLSAWAIGYLTVWRQALRRMRIVGDLLSSWTVAFLIFVTLYNVTEGSWLQQSSLFWILYISTASLLYTSGPWGKSQIEQA